MSEFSKTFTSLATARKMSVGYLSDFTGLDPSNIRRLMTGEKRPSQLTVILVSLALVSCPDRFKRDKTGEPQTLQKLTFAVLSDAAASSIKSWGSSD